MTEKRIVLVTGASSGIGEAVANMLIDAGWIVYAGARRVDMMAGLEAKGARVLRLDVTDEESMQAFVNAALTGEGRIDALVNNAGYGEYGAFEEVSMEYARHQMEVNVFGLARMTQLVIPVMREQRSGRIVNVTSMGGKMALPLGGWYHASKHAVEGLSDSIRLELKPFGVDVVLIEPGPIRTPWLDIASEHINGASAEGPYSDLVKKHNRNFTLFYSDKLAPGPEAPARAIIRALKARKPRPRYKVTISGRVMMFGNWLLPNRVYDWAVGLFYY